LTPLPVEGDVLVDGVSQGFTKPKFAAQLASLIRSGYPVLITGMLEQHGPHAVCATGFRQASNNISSNDACSVQDEGTEYVFISDDNLGPNVRFRLASKTVKIRQLDGSEKEVEVACLSPQAPNPRIPREPEDNIAIMSSYSLIPERLFVAANPDVRVRPGKLLTVVIEFATLLSKLIGSSRKQTLDECVKLTTGMQFIRSYEYVGASLESTLKANPAFLAKARLAMAEDIRPPSLHIGLGRVGWSDSTPLLDVLYDTNDGQLELPILAFVCYSAASASWLDELKIIDPAYTAPIIRAF
jgi:hypothetical protein